MALSSCNYTLGKPARKLYHGKFSMRASLIYRHVTMLRKPVSEIKLDWQIDNRNRMINEANREAQLGVSSLFHNIWAEENPIDEDHRNDLAAILNWLETTKVPYSVVSQGGGWGKPRNPEKLTIFTSDEAIVEQFFMLPGQDYELSYCHATPGEIRVNAKNGKYRQFFRQVRPSPETRSAVRQFFETNKDTIFPSPATLNYFKRVDARIREIGPTYFFDHSDEKIITLLRLIAPEIVGPSYILVSD